MKTTIIRRLLGGLAVVVLTGSLASASTITWYNNIFLPGHAAGATNSPQGLPSEYATPWVSTVQVPLFNAGTGTLTSVDIVLSWIVNATVVAANPPGGPATPFTATVNVPISLTSNGADATSIHDTATTSVSGTAPAGPSFTQFATPQGSGSSPITAVGLIAAYIGAGQQTFSFSSSTGTVGDGGASGLAFTFNGQPIDGASIAVTYTYTASAVPEPGTFMMLGSALLGVGMFIRRRRA